MWYSDFTTVKSPKHITHGKIIVTLCLLQTIASRALPSSKLAAVYLSQLYIQIEVKCDLSHPWTFVWHWCEPDLHLCICGGVQRLNTSPLAPALGRLLTHKHISLRASCLSGGPTEQMDRDAALSLSPRSSAPPLRDRKKLRVWERWRGPERKALLTAAHSIAFTINYPHLPPNEGRPEPHQEWEYVFHCICYWVYERACINNEIFMD